MSSQGDVLAASSEVGTLGEPAPLITIAVATWNRADTLARALASITAQQMPAGQTFEVCVIDNGSTDHTPEVVAAFPLGQALAIRYIHESVKGLPNVRNRAVAECRGEWLAFFDDDQTTERDWLSRLLEAAIENHVDVVGGARDLLIEVDQPPRLHPYARRLLGEVSSSQSAFYHRKFLPSTGNVLIRQSVFARLGKFDVAILDGGEDTDFFNRMIEHSISAFYEPRAVVHHLISENRLHRSYLAWIAYRHGVHVARRDLDRKSRWGATFSAIVRAAYAGVVLVPHWTLSCLFGQREDRIAAYCKIRRVAGYLDKVSTTMIPIARSVQHFREKTLHHGKR